MKQIRLKNWMKISHPKLASIEVEKVG